MKNILAILLSAIFATVVFAGENSFKNISSAEAEKLIKDKSIVIIDIRTAQEYNSGYIKGSVNIDYYKSDFKDKLSKYDKNKTYFIYCRSGRRSGSAKTIFNDLGFKNVYNLENGINEWIAEKRELVYNR